MDFMSAPQLRILEGGSSQICELWLGKALADFGVGSKLLADVLADEATRQSQVLGPESQFPQQLRIGAFIDDRLVGWSYTRGEDNQLHMINSGIFSEFRRRGIYSDLEQLAKQLKNGKSCVRHCYRLRMKKLERWLTFFSAIVVVLSAGLC